MPHRKRRGFASLAFACLVFTQSTESHASTLIDDLSLAQFALPSVISVEFGADSEKGQDLDLFGDFTINAQHRWSAGYSDNNSTVATSDEDLETNTLTVGYTYLHGSSLQFGIQYEEWGDENKLTTDTLRLDMVMDLSSKFTLSVLPQRSDIVVYGSEDIGNSGKTKETVADLRSNGIGLGLHYFHSSQWSYSVSYHVYDFSEDPETLADEDDIIALARIQMVAIDKQQAFSVHYQVDTELYSVSWARSTSAIESAQSTLTSIGVSSDILDEWTMGITAGWQNNFDDTTTGFMSGSLSYYW